MGIEDITERLNRLYEVLIDRQARAEAAFKETQDATMRSVHLVEGIEAYDMARTLKIYFSELIAKDYPKMPVFDDNKEEK